MTSKRLLVLTSTYPRYASDSTPGFVHNLCVQLSAAYEITVLAPHSRGARRCEVLDGIEIKRFVYCLPRFENLAYDGGILANLQKRPWKWVLLAPYLVSLILAVLRELRSKDFDAIHVHWILPQGPAALIARFLARQRLPIIVTSHGGDLFAFKRGLMSRLKSWVLKQASAVTFVSSFMLDKARELVVYLPAAGVLPMGVDLKKKFSPNERQREDNLLLFVGRLVEKKGVDVLLHAVPRIRVHFPSVRVVIAGDGPEKAALLQLARSLSIEKSVHFLGPVTHDALPDLYRKATIFAMPSVEAQGGDQEGFGLVLVEALGCATPVVASDYPAVRDIATEETVKLVPPANSAALADALVSLLSDQEERSRLGAAGRRHALTRFDWDLAGERYRAFIGEAINSGR